MTVLRAILPDYITFYTVFQTTPATVLKSLRYIYQGQVVNYGYDLLTVDVSDPLVYMYMSTWLKYRILTKCTRIRRIQGCNIFPVVHVNTSL